MNRTLNTVDERLWMDRVDREPDNIRAVYQWAIMRRRREFAKRLNINMHVYHATHRSSIFEISYWIKATLALPIEESDTPYSLLTEAQAMNYAGDAAFNHAEYAEAEACFNEQLRIAILLNNQVEMAAAYHGLGFIAMLQGDAVRARKEMEQALTISQAIHDQDGAVSALFDLGRIARVGGELEQARMCLEEALSGYYKLSNLSGAFLTLLTLGHVLRAQEDFDGARTRYRQGFQLQQQMHYTYPVDHGLDGVAGVAAAAGDPVRAAYLFGAAHAIRREVGRDVQDDLKVGYERDLALARSQLSPKDWQAAWDAGMAMSLDEAVKFALAE